MEETQKVETICPTCGTRMTVDAATGAVLWHEEPPKAKERASLEERIRALEDQKRATAEKVAKEQQALKDRSRILEEKVKEAMKRVDKDAPPPTRPIDLD